MKRWLLALLPPALLACNALLGLEELSPFDGEDSDGAVDTTPVDGDDAGTSSGGGGGGSSGGSSGLSDAGNPGGDSGTEGDAGVAPCDPAEVPDAEHGVFVRWDAPPNGDGRPNDPFASIAEALHALDGALDAGTDAGPQKSIVYVYEGIYNETEELLVHDRAALTIDGAWRGDAFPNWTRNCADNRRHGTVINTVDGNGLQFARVGHATLKNLSVFAGMVAESGSPITVHAIDCGQLLLSNVAVLAEDGANSETPAPPDHGPLDCSGPCTTSITAGNEGSASQTQRAGWFDEHGYTRPRGEDGEQGGSGSRQEAPPAPRALCTDHCSDQCTAVTQEREGQRGACGCGGGGGLGGRGALGGGASVGVLSNGPVRAEYSIIHSNDGGHGAGGGPGGVGGAPTVGDPGDDGQCVPVDGCCSVEQNQGPQCYLRSDPLAPAECAAPMQPIPGGAGGGGGPGGRGGAGGPGAGGPSFGVVLFGGGTLDVVQSQIAHGFGGVGVPPAPGGETGVLFKQPPR